MKTILIATKLLLLSAFIIAAGGLFAQEKVEKQEPKKYSLHMVKDENGKEEIIDKTFASRAEMDAYMKEHKIDLPEAPEALAPAATPGEKIVIEKTIDKHNGKNNDKKEKKIIIIEKEEGSLGGNTDLEITYTNLNSDERAQVIQRLLNEKGKAVQIIQMKKPGQNVKSESQNTQPPTGIENLTPEQTSNLSDVTLFPNPANGQFHVTFNVVKPADIKLRITDLQGNEVYASALNNYSGKFEKDINRPDLAKGTYVLDITAGAEKKTTKVVMQ